MRNLYMILMAFCTAVAITIYPSCTKDFIEPVGEITDSVSFKLDVIPIFNAHCNESGCHSSGGVSPDLSPDVAWSNLWLYDLVDTTDAESSIIYERMTDNGDPMPPSGTLSNEPAYVLAWIKQGALDN